MKEVINNNNKCKLKYWFAMLYIHCGKFMTGSVFTYQRLTYFVDLLKFGRRFSHAQKRLTISKTSCIISPVNPVFISTFGQVFLSWILPLPAFAHFKSTMETTEQCVKYIQCYQQRHQVSFWCLYQLLWTNYTYCSGVSFVEFEINANWDIILEIQY